MEDQKPFMIIRIHDNGVGIPEDELPYIFEPFYRVDKSRSKDTGGYGLGLSLCKTVMEAHQGKVHIESSLSKGTTVSLFFPHIKDNGAG
jgi:two-component system phosphate regulon sensor histidine kinase PhoR